jgi:transposase
MASLGLTWCVEQPKMALMPGRGGAVHVVTTQRHYKGRVYTTYKVAKHFELAIGAASFCFDLLHDKLAAEAALDGLCVIRTGVRQCLMSADDTIRNYETLTTPERAFRSLKTVDLKVRPIHHLANRVRAHIFLCMLAWYVEWHMREARREITFAGEDQHDGQTRDPVAPAQRSDTALRTSHGMPYVDPIVARDN